MKGKMLTTAEELEEMHSVTHKIFSIFVVGFVVSTLLSSFYLRFLAVSIFLGTMSVISAKMLFYFRARLVEVMVKQKGGSNPREVHEENSETK